MKPASFGSPCLKLPRYAEVRKMPRERNQARRDSQFLFGSNATGEHRLKLALVGKLKKPRAFVGLNIKRDLPVVDHHSKKA